MPQKTVTLDDVAARLEGLERKLDALAVNPSLDEELPMKAPATAEFLSRIEGREVAVSTVYNRVNNRTIPFHRDGTRIWFYASEILKQIKSSSMKVVPGVAIVDQDKQSAISA